MLIAKTAWKLVGCGGASTGHPGSPPSEQGSTTGRYTCPQAIHSTIGSTMAANRPTRRKLIGTPKERLGQRGIKHSNGWAQSPPVLQAGSRFQIVFFEK